ncbi:dual oxidase 2-like [Pyxicephalus adspersus]|uniref:dual oxidase 2-like n=1 Tax=Pyxicephalus adspersus TaxID=30357 RepID=UPI003B592AFB
MILLSFTRAIMAQIFIFMLLLGTTPFWNCTDAQDTVNWEVQRFDGWYNNLAYHSRGSKGSKLLRFIPASYSDGVYQVAKDLPNPREVSNALTPEQSTFPSPRNLTVMAVYFGHQVLSEVVSTDMPACPAEFLNINIPLGDPAFDPENKSNVVLPYQRVQWYHDTGKSPNSPRVQVNSVTAWIDGSSIYGPSHSWSDALRSFSGGKLASGPNGFFPPDAKKSLPVFRMRDPCTGQGGDKGIYSFGNAMANESPFRQAQNMVWYWYHNYMAKLLAANHTNWSDEVLFQHARKWVIAVYQRVIFYEWLPTFLSRDVQNYTGYNQHVDPSISPEFAALTAQMLYTMMPSGVYMRDKDCKFLNVSGPDSKMYPAHRLCNNYWSRQNLDMKNLTYIEHLLLGMCSQVAEKEDHIIVSDLRDYWYGQMQYSRMDLLAASIQRGRDMGLPSYNKVRSYYGFSPMTWENISNSEIKQLSALYDNNIERLELIPGIMLEMNGSAGSIIPEIILNQFYRLRDGDRFWFENINNGLFTEEEVAMIHNITFHDVLVAATGTVDSTLQEKVFVWKSDDPCPQPAQLKSDNLEKCVPVVFTNYFEGSSIGFGFIIVALCSFPVVSLLIALVVAQHRKKSFIRMQKLKSNPVISNQSNLQGFQAIEWCGPDEPLQPVFVQLNPDHVIQVVAADKSDTRTIHLRNQQAVQVAISNNAGSKSLRIRIPKEYDLVLLFNNKEEQSSFSRNLKEFIDSAGILSTFILKGEKDILKESVSKKQRREMLETFFRHSLSHVLEINKADAGVILKKEITDALQCELSREEFAESLGLEPNAHFVESMFCTADKDCNGYLSFKEFCYILASLLTGSVESKLRFIFSMHDINGNGLLTKEECATMLRSFNQLSSFLSKDQTEKAIEIMFSEAGLPCKPEISWEEFYAVFKQHSNIINYVTLQTQGSMPPLSTKIQINNRVSFISRRKDDNDKSNSENNNHILESNGQELRKRAGRKNNYSPNGPNIYTTARREKYESSKVRQKIQQFKRLIENYRRHIICMAIFCGISAGVFTERAYYYGFASPSTGIAEVTYVGLIISRGSAACISFMYSFILLTMCRNLITFLRETFLNQYIPFDAAVDFHRLIAMSALVFSILHTLGHVVNVYIFSITPINILSCLFPTVFSYDGSEYPKTFFWWVFATVPGFTGVLLLAVLALMYVFSTHYFRRVSFRGFWIMHHLYVVLYILTIIHGSFALIQSPKFHIYFIAPAIIFAVDKMISLSRKKTEIEVLEVKKHPSGVTCLQFQRPHDFDYKSGQWVRIACLSLGTNEYHPFTLTSAPHEDVLSLHIRAVGPWTTRLRELYTSNNTASGKYPKLFLDGPFGEGHQEWNMFDVSVLVGGGIGVTPFASILKDLVFKSSVNARINCKKVYFIWVTRTQKQYEWLIDIIREVEEIDQNNLLSVHIYITQLTEKFDFRTAMLYICERHFQKIQNQSLLTGLRSVTHFGRPPFVSFLNSLQEVHPKVKKIGVFSCGPPGMTKNVENACRKLNKRDECHFIHHYENF